MRTPVSWLTIQRLAITVACSLPLLLSQTTATASDWVDGPEAVFQLPPRPTAPRSIPSPPYESDTGGAGNITRGSGNRSGEAGSRYGDAGSSSGEAGSRSGVAGDRTGTGTPDMPTMGVTDGHRPAVPHGLEGGVSSTSVRERAGEQPTIWNQPPPPAGLPQTAAVAPKVYSGWLSETHPDLTRMDKDAVIEVKGQWDDSGHALHNFGFGFNKISPSALSKTNLANTNILIVDCAGEIPQTSLDIIRKFVADGGYLITTDWSLDNCLARAIPGFIEWNSANSESELVDATTNQNPEASDNSDLLLNVVPRAYWKLDKKCQMVKVIRKDAVTVLARSKRLAYQDPTLTFALNPKSGIKLDHVGILACTFRYEKGRVLHLVGHFDNNTDLAFKNSLPDPAPRIGISLRQAIAANFIAAALKAHPRPVAAKSN